MSSFTKNYEEEINNLNFSNLLISLQDLIQYVIYALKKPSGMRTDKEIEVLKQLIKKSPSLKSIGKKFGSDINQELCRRLEYKHFHSEHQLISPGSSGHGIYVLLKGRVKTTVPPPETNPSDHENPVELPAEIVIETNFGAGFGDLGKFDSTSKLNPNATVVCQEESYFAVLSKNNYERIVMAFRKKKQEEQTNFLSTVAIFHGWSNHALRHWVEEFDNKEIYTRKHVIYKQGEKATHIYVIKSGSVHCTKAIPIQGNISGGHEVCLDENNQVFLAENDVFSRNIEISIIGPGQVLGDEEALEAYLLSKEKRKGSQASPQQAQKGLETNRSDTSNIKEVVEADFINIKRETTMAVDSQEAEIWSMPISTFFANLQMNRSEFQRVVGLIGEKKKLRKARIENVLRNSQELAQYLKGQKTTNFKQDIMSTIRSRKFIRSIAEDFHGRTDQDGEGSKSKLETTQKIGVVLPTQTEKVNICNSPTRSPDKENPVNQSFYDIFSRQESLRSSITEAWSPIKFPKQPFQIQFEFDSSPKKEFTSLQTKNQEKIEEERTEIEEASTVGIPIKIENSNPQSIPDVRTAEQVPVIVSRTSYIKSAVEKKLNVHEKIRQKVFCRPGTMYHHDRSNSKTETNENDSSFSSGLVKWKLTMLNWASKKKMETVPSNFKQSVKKPGDSKPVENKLISQLYKKARFNAKIPNIIIADNSLPKIDQNRSREELNAAKLNRIDTSLIKREIDRSRFSSCPPLLELNNNVSRDQQYLFEDNKEDKSDIYLRTEDREEQTPVYPKGSLQSMVSWIGRRASKEELNNSKKTEDRKKCYLSTLFPGFRPKSLMKKEMDPVELYRQSVMMEAQDKLNKLHPPKKPKNVNISADYGSKYKLNREKSQNEELSIENMIKEKRERRQAIKKKLQRGL